MRRTVRATTVAVVALLLAAPSAHAGEPTTSDYSDPAYAEYDADNASRSSARQSGQTTDLDYGMAFFDAGWQTWLAAQGNQVADLRDGRLHTGLGQVLPGGAVGDPQAYGTVPTRRIQFLSRTGAKLSGRIWGSEAPGPRPGILITTGSIQGTEHMYWWAARALAAAGYTVMTWDVQGQGESESLGHAPGDVTPTGDGFPSQQDANFVDGTVDALRFFLSTPGDPYVPTGWAAADVAASKAGSDGSEQIDWVNPGYAALRGGRKGDGPVLGIAGHSLGASAVSAVQQCSDQAELWRTLELCGGRSFPIRAVVGWDSLRGGDTITPVVPGMNQQGDGYFLNPQPTPSFSSDGFDDHLAAHDAWRTAGVDTYSLTVRGGTHLEWAEIPYILPATAYGTDQAEYYTVAWFDRYVHPSKERRTAAARRLLDGPKPEGVEVEAPWRANYFSAKYLGAFSFHGTGGKLFEATDLRAYAGLSPVGDWAGANADRQGRVLP